MVRQITFCSGNKPLKIHIQKFLLQLFFKFYDFIKKSIKNIKYNFSLKILGAIIQKSLNVDL